MPRGLYASVKVGVARREDRNTQRWMELQLGWIFKDRWSLWWIYWCSRIHVVCQDYKQQLVKGWLLYWPYLADGPHGHSSPMTNQSEHLTMHTNTWCLLSKKMMDNSILKASHARPSPTLFLTSHVPGRSLTLEGTAAGSLSISSSQLLLFGTSTFLLQWTFCFWTMGLQKMLER